jgi:hypothetical protein
VLIELRAARERDVEARAVVRPRLGAARVAARAHDEALLDERADLVGRARGLVALDQRRVRVLGLGGHEHRAAVEVVRRRAYTCAGSRRPR